MQTQNCDMSMVNTTNLPEGIQTGMTKPMDMQGTRCSMKRWANQTRNLFTNLYTNKINKRLRMVPKEVKSMNMLSALLRKQMN
ncbi:hypothetical protein DPMN_179949 [Dreissena polymorpha]|uniref:Uncharacterized protein n=1 Tax=Dreissena polymorpha TaxID=45954 RepID=A0A9D4IMN7_DREPO|nr:hypothetical protein DPMN_179949 [Dreissena polymorpha]